MMAEKSKIPAWCAGKEWCAVTCTADLIGKKWHPVILERLMEKGEIGFNDLKKEVDGISSKVLSESLDDLQDKKLIQRQVVNEKPVRVKYKLTEKGESLRKVIKAMKEWGNNHLEKAEKSQSVI